MKFNCDISRSRVPTCYSAVWEKALFVGILQKNVHHWPHEPRRAPNLHTCLDKNKKYVEDHVTVFVNLSSSGELDIHVEDLVVG